MMLEFYASSFTSIFGILKVIFSYAIYWAPIVLGFVFWDLWKNYVRLDALAKTKWVLLGIRLPNNIIKTPLSMELVLSAMHQGSQGTWYDRYWGGKFMAWFSLELVSIGGDVHFYIRTIDKFKNYIEAQLYSQFPGIEVYEADDYINEVNGHTSSGGEWEIFGTEFALSKPDPYPIKTYLDYKLDQQIKKEEEISSRTDPLLPSIEFLGSIGKNERVWMQILIQATHKRFHTPGTFFGKRDWKGEMKDLIAKMQAKAVEGKLSKADAEAVAAMEREVSKFGFDCGIRVLYLGRDGGFNPLNIAGVTGMMKHYNSESLNSFKLKNATSVDFPWQDFSGEKVRKIKRNMFRAYCARGYFYPPFKKKPFILNTEEIATIYHFPGGMEATPGFVTISSRKAEPPSNLPV